MDEMVVMGDILFLLTNMDDYLKQKIFVFERLSRRDLPARRAVYGCWYLLDTLPLKHLHNFVFPANKTTKQPLSFSATNF